MFLSGKLQILCVFIFLTSLIVRGLLIAPTNAQTATSMYNVETSRLSNDAYTVGLTKMLYFAKFVMVLAEVFHHNSALTLFFQDL